MSGAAPVCLAPNPPGRRPHQPLPAGTCDCHIHVFAAGAPLATPRSYTPQILTLADWLAQAAALGIGRAVLVQPSVYGRDNSVLLAALAAQPERLRGVVVVDPETPPETFGRLHAQGVRGIRVNTRNLGGLPLSAAAALGASIAGLGWAIHFQVDEPGLDALAGMIPRLPVPAVLDHMGFVANGDPERRAAGLERLLRLLDTGRVWVKLSGAYRLGGGPAAIAGLVARLCAARPDRLIWGSDWPHTELSDHMPDDADLVDEAMGWLADPALARRVLVDNPAQLYWPEERPGTQALRGGPATAADGEGRDQWRR